MGKKVQKKGLSLLLTFKTQFFYFFNPLYLIGLHPI